MNIKSIIALALINFFAHTHTPLLTNNIQPPSLLPTTHQPIQQFFSNNVPSKNVKLQQTVQGSEQLHFHNTEKSRLERSNKHWQEDGEPYQTAQTEDINHNHHKIYKWKKQGRPNEVNEWVDSKTGSSVHSYKYLDEQGCIHEIRVVTDVNGKKLQKHYKKDKEGNITEVQDTDNNQAIQKTNAVGGYVSGNLNQQ